MVSLLYWVVSYNDYLDYKRNVKPPKIQKMDPKSKITRKRGKKGTRKSTRKRYHYRLH